jgi:hypothetical protein
MYYSDTDSDTENTSHFQEEVEQLYSSMNISNDDMKKNVTYDGLSYLIPTVETLLYNIDKNISYEIHICAYHINTSSKIPFIQYFLYKPFHPSSEYVSQFCFPHFKYKDEKDIFIKSLNTIDILCRSYYKETQFDFKGYIINETDIFMFYDCSHIEIDTLKMNKTNDLWLVTIDEIINYQKVCETPINQLTVNLFYKYEKLSYISNVLGEPYDLPIIAYTFCPIKKLDFISTFGPSTQNSIFGNHLYFTDYLSAITNYDNDNFIGLIRCVLFLGKMKMVLNLDNDQQDTSNTALSQLKINTYDARLKLRITDYDSNWSLLYDSLYVGKVLLDDGSSFTDGPLWVLKEHSQYNMLSTHINKVYSNDTTKETF